jgi:bisanhydrobacterioruberin hydratase
MTSATQSDAIAATFTTAGRLTRLGLQVASGLALACWLLALWQVCSGQPLPGKPGWPEALLLVTTAIATLLALARQLPGQNVLLAATIIGLVGSIAHTVCAQTALPFGPIQFTAAGPMLFEALPLAMPLVWIIVVLNSRGVARLILRPWRKLRTYGFWLIGITTALTVLFNLALEPFATRVNHNWLWLPTKFPFTWHGMPLTNSLGWALTTLLILAFATPPLINKQLRSRKSTPDYHPLVAWLLLLGLFVAGAIAGQLWAAAGVAVAIGAVTTVFAMRGARW